MIQVHFGCLLLTLLSISQSIFGQQEPYNPYRLYSKNELKSDLLFIRNKLEKTHPALYRYSTKSYLNFFFDSLDHAINNPMNEQEFLSILTLLNSKIKDGHTMFLPSDDAMSYNTIKGRFFPFTVFISDGKIYITQNCSYDSSIRPGEEILSINGISTPTIISELMIRQIRDGNNQTYPTWILNHYFSSYYSFAFGQHRLFLLELKKATGELYKKQVIALTKDSIRFFRQYRYAKVNPSGVEGQGINLEEKLNIKTAILTIKSFDPDLLESVYKQNYKHVMDSLFRQLNQQHTNNLILDLRDNQGGDFEPARYLLSYLISKPSVFLLNSEESMLIQPNSNHFRGMIYVLINGGSFSSTAIVISILERDKRGIFIGEETGGNKYIISGDPIEVLLPITKIRSYISTTTYNITTGVNKGHGVFPTYPVKIKIENILQSNDPSKAFALKLITKR